MLFFSENLKEKFNLEKICKLECDTEVLDICGQTCPDIEIRAISLDEALDYLIN